MFASILRIKDAAYLTFVDKKCRGVFLDVRIAPVVVDKRHGRRLASGM